MRHENKFIILVIFLPFSSEISDFFPVYSLKATGAQNIMSTKKSPKHNYQEKKGSSFLFLLFLYLFFWRALFYWVNIRSLFILALILFSFFLQYDYYFFPYLVNSWGHPKHLSVRIYQNVGLVSHLVVSIGTEMQQKNCQTQSHFQI